MHFRPRCGSATLSPPYAGCEPAHRGGSAEAKPALWLPRVDNGAGGDWIALRSSLIGLVLPFDVGLEHKAERLSREKCDRERYAHDTSCSSGSCSGSGSGSGILRCVKESLTLAERIWYGHVTPRTRKRGGIQSYPFQLPPQ